MGSKRVRPKALGPGDRVALVAPSGALLEPDDLRRAEELCAALGFEPRLAPHASSRHGYLAGTDDERAADLNAALSASDVAAVWCLRGGYGVHRILHRVDFDALRDHPKAVIGFSDITALLLAITGRTGLVSFHGPVARNPLTAFSREHWELVLTAPRPAGLLRLRPPPAGVTVPVDGRVTGIVPGVAEGPLFGGNLTILAGLAGTPFFPDLAGAVLFLEDIDEDLYRVDRALAQLRLAGALDSVAGVAVGQFTGLRRVSGSGGLGLEEVLLEHLGRSVPLALGFPFGHVDDQWTLPIGTRARLDTGAGTLELLEPAVS